MGVREYGPLIPAISRPDIVIVGHNIAYDIAVLMNDMCDMWWHGKIFDAYDSDRITDTLLRQQLIDIAHGELGGYTNHHGKFIKYSYSLAALAERLLGITLEKGAVRTSYESVAHLPVDKWPSEYQEYAQKDADTTLAVYQKQEEQVQLLADQYRQTRAAIAFHLTSVWGIVTDESAIERLEAVSNAEYKRALAVCQRFGLVRATGVRDTKAAKEVMEKLCAKKGLELKRTDTDGVCMDEEACLRTGSQLLTYYAQLTSLQGLVKKKIPQLRNGLIAPIQPRYQTLQDTGRSACLGHDSKSENPSTYGFQMQNLPRKPGVRECFVPRPGYVFVVSDYVGLELHTWAQVCIWSVGVSAMADALNNDRDPHLIMAAELESTTYESILERYKAEDAQAVKSRQFGKIANFGFQGGMGSETFRTWARVAYSTNFSEAFANELRETWKRTWPESVLYFEYITQLLKAGGGLASVPHFGSERWRGNLSFSVCANTFFQGLGADAAKAAFYAVARECWTGSMRGCHTVGFVHDEIITEAPEEKAHEMAEIQERIMIAEAYKWLPDVKPKCETLLTRRLSKKAKRIVANGRLVPWDWN